MAGGTYVSNERDERALSCTECLSTYGSKYCYKRSAGGCMSLQRALFILFGFECKLPQRAKERRFEEYGQFWAD